MSYENLYEEGFGYPIYVRAGDPDGYYEDHGWLLGKDEGEYVILKFSHCSCYGTEEGSGEVLRCSLTDLKNIMLKQYDLDALEMERPAREDDYDYNIMRDFHEQCLEYIAAEEAS